MTKVAITSIILAILAIVGSCQPAMLAANHTTTPATQPDRTFSIGPAASTAPAIIASYITSPAPATVHVNALNLLDHPVDWLTDHNSWNFGDTAGQIVTDPRTGKSANLNAAIQGPVAAYEYENPGTYVITLTRTPTTGPTQIYQAMVTVPASQRTVFYISPDGSDANPGTDPNHPLQSAIAAVNRLADHTEFRFRRGSVYKIQPEFPMKHRDILLDCYGDTTLPLPVLQRNPIGNISAEDCMIFTTCRG